jgi:alanyl-tRNA synthetase
MWCLFLETYRKKNNMRWFKVFIHNLKIFSCEGKYSFIGVGTGKGAKGNKITYSDAWNGFKKSLTSARVPCTAIDRYPVVARWRNDVDYVAAGIYCFQPFCVTGEMDPPANPLICP